ncbi:hypothetical protein JTB14_018360 [Gonioctena quinquepunctata]|nr:hypothetical protein JTB14_018360 [Gonioctena quinquepunctata]
MLSGVGPKEHLQKLGIKVIQNLSGVGSALTDEVINQSLLFSSKIYLPAQTQNEQIEDFLHGFGPLAGAASSQGTAWYKTDINKDTEYNDIHLYCGTTTHTQLEVKVTNWKNESYYSAWGNTTNAILMTLIFTNPRSRGTVRLQSSSPFDYPLIDFKHLSDPGNKDIAVMYEGIKLAFRLMETAPFQKLSVKYEGGPVPGCRNLTFRSKEYWHCFLRYTSSSGYHTTGTCPMGSDTQKGAVVDNNLKVFGISKLRVADGSVIPTTTAGPPSATCIMIGEKLAEVLKAQYS